jgi:hypothetical protein
VKHVLFGVSALCLLAAQPASAQSHGIRTLGFEAPCTGDAFPASSFDVFGFRALATTLYAPCGVQSIISTASSGGGPQLFHPGVLGGVQGMDGSVVLAGGTDSFLATGPLEFVFEPPVNEVSLNVLEMDRANGLVVRAIDAQGQIIDTARPPSAANQPASYSFVTPVAAAARRVVRLQVEYMPQALDTWFIDRLRFNSWHCGDAEAELNEACDDGNTVVCDGCNSQCLVTFRGCLSGTSCVPPGVVVPATNGCAICDPTASPVTGDVAPRPQPAGAACDDGQFCSVADACNGQGACVGTARDCSDTLLCTNDSCNEATDSCVHGFAGGGCIIGATCVPPGAVNPQNPCEVCTPASSTTAYSPVAAGTVCGNPSCSGGAVTTASLCDAKGVCAAGTMMTCEGAMPCADAIRCMGPCTRDDACAIGSACVAGVCTPKAGAGAACIRGNDCLSALCTDGVCCDTACDGPCESCALVGKEGVCSGYEAGEDPETECGEHGACDGGRACAAAVRSNGLGCEFDGDCSSSHCVDGVCCDAACAGDCESCREVDALGTCSAVTDGSYPEGECDGGALCEEGECSAEVAPTENANGERCESADTCESGHCAGGVCCDTACEGPCQACGVVGSEGTCLPHAAGTDPDDGCAGEGVCDGAGHCVSFETRGNGFCASAAPQPGRGGLYGLIFASSLLALGLRRRRVQRNV